MELQIGQKFTSKWFEGIVEIMKIDEKENELYVYILSYKNNSWTETWNLNHTIWGFQNGDYKNI